MTTQPLTVVSLRQAEFQGSGISDVLAGNQRGEATRMAVDRAVKNAREKALEWIAVLAPAGLRLNSFTISVVPWADACGPNASDPPGTNTFLSDGACVTTEFWKAPGHGYILARATVKVVATTDGIVLTNPD